jgi:hypothetical protein
MALILVTRPLCQSCPTADAIVEYETQLHPAMLFDGEAFPTTVLAPSKALVIESLVDFDDSG